MNETERLPESFTLDHDEVMAPYVRLAGRHQLVGGGEVVKWDVRLTQPNESHVSMPAMHSIEHSLATTLRTITDAVVDISPMGCQTGFYIAVDSSELGEYDVFTDVLARAIDTALELGHVPGSSRTECGWAQSHSLEDMKSTLRSFIDARSEWSQVFRGVA